MKVFANTNRMERETDLVSGIIAGHITFTTVDAHFFIYKGFNLRKHIMVLLLCPFKTCYV